MIKRQNKINLIEIDVSFGLIHQICKFQILWNNYNDSLYMGRKKE